ncbi:MAG: 3-keto-5-aminohexanoate cleavage protein [Gemmatimonadetes bacterium]|nr:3-keto-5-aminohexanoate cleavage protein [Gemmatimonadota bacterium]
MAPRKTILTCAVTGSPPTAKKNPAVPVTPRQIADSCIEAVKAGAAIVHVHVRDPDSGLASMDLALYREVVDRLRSAPIDMIINLTTGPGQRFAPGDDDPRIPGPGTNLTHPKIRVQHVEALRPEICSLDVATMASGDAFGSTVMLNTVKTLAIMATAIRDAGVMPELEVFDTGHVRLARHMIETGLIAPPGFFQFCLGIEWGAPDSPEALGLMRSLAPPDCQWAAFGIGPRQFPMVAMAAAAGGHVRVGLEDNLYLERGVLAPSNAALVERAVDIVESLGGSLATPAEARAILGLAPRG